MSGTRLRILRRDGSELLVDAGPLAAAFFSTDPSSVGARSFDALAGRTASDRIELSDVSVLNRTMTARSKLEAWEPIVAMALPWLAELSPTLDLVETSEEEWRVGEAERLISEALLGVLGHQRGLSVGTKMLHLKRPRLFPILDSLVAQMLGFGPPNDRTPASRARHGLQLIAHLREQGRRNMEPLTELQAQLAAAGFARPLVRLLDAVLWGSHPASALPVRRSFHVSVPSTSGSIGGGR